MESGWSRENSQLHTLDDPWKCYGWGGRCKCPRGQMSDGFVRTPYATADGASLPILN